MKKINPENHCTGTDRMVVKKKKKIVHEVKSTQNSLEIEEYNPYTCGQQAQYYWAIDLGSFHIFNNLRQRWIGLHCIIY